MDPATLIPTPDPLPAPWWIFQALLLLTFLCHILLMNVMVGSAFIALVHHLRRDGGGCPATELIADKLPYTIAFAVNFGVAPLLFLQVIYGHLFYTSSILMAVFWLSIIGILILAYYGAYAYKYQYERLQGGRALLTGLITLLLLAVAFLFSNNLTLMAQPETWPRFLARPSGLLLNLAEPTLWPRYLHFMTAAVAVAGLAQAIYRQAHLPRDGSGDTGPVTAGLAWYGYATMVNFPLGLWFLASLPAGLVPAGAPGALWHGLLIAGLLCGGLSAIQALGGRLRPTLILALATVVLMVLLRDLLRTFYLKPWFSVDELSLVPSWSPLVLFLLVFVGGLALIAWMIRMAGRSLHSGEVR